MNQQDVAHTRAWWTRLCADPAAMNLWLQKLERTEVEGSKDYYRAVATYLETLTHQQQANMIHIATDEARHGQLIRACLRARGIDGKLPVEKSRYWAEMATHIRCVRSFAAANYFGELLAYERFEVIPQHPATPADVRALISQIAPDEESHRRMLERMAGGVYIEAMREFHDRAVQNLKGNNNEPAQ